MPHEMHHLHERHNNLSDAVKRTDYKSRRSKAMQPPLSRLPLACWATMTNHWNWNVIRCASSSGRVAKHQKIARSETPNKTTDTGNRMERDEVRRTPHTKQMFHKEP